MRTKLVILRGGPSSEYEVSLRSGHKVREYTPEHYEVSDVLIDKNGKWHINGVEKSPERILRHFDVAFNAMHGEYGEDGKVQKILDAHNIPYTGSKAFASSLAMNKIKTKELLSLHGIKTPKFTYLKKDDYAYGDLSDIYASIKRPLVVKPAGSGSSVGLAFVETFEELVEAVNNVFKTSKLALIEEYIQGREATCGVLDHSNGNDLYVFYPIEIIYNKDNKVWDYNSKYSNDLHQCICPSSFGTKVKKNIQDMAHKAHSVLGLSHYSRSDFIVTDNDDVYFLETNTLPGLTETSLYPVGLKAAGIEMPEFIDHVVTLALKGK